MRPPTERHLVRWGLALALLTAACGGGGGQAKEPERRLTAQDEVLKVARVWQALEESRGIRGAPEKIARFETKQRSTLTFRRGHDMAEELLELKELFELRSGATYECRTEIKLPVRVRFGRRQGSPAVELSRPARIARRQCRPGDFPQPEITIAGGTVRFRLVDEQLVGFAPLSEKRVFLPTE